MKSLFEVIAVIKNKAYIAGIIEAEDEIDATLKGKRYYGDSVVGARLKK